jgi:hypothetical protein
MNPRPGNATATGKGLLRQLARIFANVAICYGVLAVTTSITLVVADTLEPSLLGDFNLTGAWIYLMSWLVVALPLIVAGVLTLDLVLRFVPAPRVVAPSVAAIPGALLVVFSVAAPQLAVVGLYLLVSGVAAGLLLRLPDK